MNKKLMTIIVPCYNEQACIKSFYDEIVKVSSNNEFNNVTIGMLFVNDGSVDRTLEIIKELKEKSENVSFISLSRNFGKESAILAGFEHAQGDLIALMDADLQDPPNLLPEMYSYIENNGFDCVATMRSSREGEPFIRSIFSKLFYKTVNIISDTKIVDGARDFRLMTKQMAEAIKSINEYNRFSKGIFSWVGFNIKWIEYKNINRVAGKTKWSFFKLLKYSLDGIIAFSTFPLFLVSITGIIISIISLIGAFVIIVRTIIYGDPVVGWPSLAVLVSLIGGLHLFCLGIVGQYLSKTYMETKNRPKYIIKEIEIRGY